MGKKQPKAVISEKMGTNEVTDLGFLPGNIYQTPLQREKVKLSTLVSVN